MFRYHDVGASSYFKKPRPFCKSKSVIKVQKTDDFCFFWCILAH